MTARPRTGCDPGATPEREVPCGSEQAIQLLEAVFPLPRRGYVRLERIGALDGEFFPADCLGDLAAAILRPDIFSRDRTFVPIAFTDTTESQPSGMTHCVWAVVPDEAAVTVAFWHPAPVFVVGAPGYHRLEAYWPLRQAVPADQADDISMRLTERLGGDRTAGAARAGLHLPGSERRIGYRDYRLELLASRDARIDLAVLERAAA